MLNNLKPTEGSRKIKLDVAEDSVADLEKWWIW